MRSNADHTRKRRTAARTTLLSPGYLTVRPLEEWLQQVAVQYAHGTLLDVGCGNKPYAGVFLEHVEQYIGADVHQNSHNSVDTIIDISGRLPFEDASFDTVLSTQVLEHVENPGVHLREFARVLRAGGILVLTVPASYMLHEEPYDYHRFTLYGVKHLLQQSHFSPVRIDTAGGAWRLIGQILINHKSFGRKWTVPLLSGAVYYSTVLVSNVLFSLLDNLNTNRKDPANYLVIARRETGK
ncbi:MAG: class I SAM-dependent methyltransferase [Bacteroidota bacterium]